MSEKKKTIIIILTIIVILLSIAVASYIYQNVYTFDTYNCALELIDNESFTEAKTELEKIVEFDYKDTDDLIKLCEAHISYDNGCCGVYSDIEKLKFEYQQGERREKIKAFIEKSRAEYKEFFDELVKNSKPKSSDNSSIKPSYSSGSSSTYKSKSYSKKSYSNDDDYDEYNARDYKFAEDFYDDHYEDFFDFEDAEDYFNAHND